MGHPDTAATTASPARPGSIAKRLGIAGFTFFLVKGLLWLVLPGLIAAAL
ncbi:MAG: hypothetical protein MUC56_13510 [Thermoanaerobaculales bacterium]|jgi:hypothetical protein|nr:hypothetical protein [Thermoanaerobaculales bacterium]